MKLEAFFPSVDLQLEHSVEIRIGIKGYSLAAINMPDVHKSKQVDKKHFQIVDKTHRNTSFEISAALITISTCYISVVL